MGLNCSVCLVQKEWEVTEFTLQHSLKYQGGKDMQQKQGLWLTWWTHKKNSFTPYNTTFRFTPPEEDSQRTAPRVGGFTSKLARCCLPEGRKRVDGEKPEAMTSHSSSPHGYGMFTACPPSSVFPLWSLSLHFYSFEIDNSLSVYIYICLCLQLASVKLFKLSRSAHHLLYVFKIWTEIGLEICYVNVQGLCAGSPASIKHT